MAGPDPAPGPGGAAAPYSLQLSPPNRIGFDPLQNRAARAAHRQYRSRASVV